MTLLDSPIHALDVWALHGLYAIRSVPVTQFMIDVSELGAVYTLFGLSCVIALVLVQHKHRAHAYGLLAAMASTGLAVLSLKYLVARPRPDIFFQAYPEVWYSFPSWHAAGIAAFAVFLVLAIVPLLPKPYRRLSTGILIPLIFLVGFTRIYLGVHYMSDVIAGWLIGCILAYIVYRLMRLTPQS